MERFERQEGGPFPPYEMELHVIRLGDIAFATNDFELFTDFGTQIKRQPGTSNASHSHFAGPGSYVPTERAARAGGYSATAESNQVGPPGGQALVEQTVKAINLLWPDH